MEFDALAGFVCHQPRQFVLHLPLAAVADRVHASAQTHAALQVQDGLGPQGVLGVIPEALTPREISSELIGDTKIVGDMHQRKVGGVGTQRLLLITMSCHRLLAAMSAMVFTPYSQPALQLVCQVSWTFQGARMA